MAFLEANSMYVVLIVTVILCLAFIVYMWRVDNRLSRIESEMMSRDSDVTKSRSS